MKLKPYAEYSPCPHPWLKKLPVGWDLRRVKYVADPMPSNVDKKSKDDELPVLLCNYTDVYYNETVDSSLQFMQATATAEQIKKFALKNDDVVITKDSEDPNDIGVPTQVIETVPSLVCGYHLAIVRATKICAPFLKRVFDSDYLRKVFATAANGLTRYGLGSYAIRNALVPVPPWAEQKAIATFLDNETARIDRLIEKQQQLIALLKEKRQAMISHAVTKGLDPNAPMKDSGVEWLGVVPEHWIISKIKYVSTGFLYGTSADCNASETGTPVLRIPNIKDGYVDFADLKYANFSLEEESRYLLKKDDILVVRTNGNPQLVGKNALFQDQGKYMFASYLIKISPKPEVCPSFLSILMNSESIREMLTLSARTSAGNYNMNIEGLSSISIPLPQIDEQRRIVGFVEERVNKIEYLFSKAIYAVNLLQERRTALVSAAVTGKIDVRNHPSAQPTNKEVA